MTDTLSFLESDRQRWLAESFAEVAGSDTKSASHYLLSHIFARLERLRRTGTADAILKQDLQAVRVACDRELVTRARAKGLTSAEAWVPIEEIAPIDSNVPAVGWPCTGKLACLAFTLSLAQPTPEAAMA